jgi:hypothetical protein
VHARARQLTPEHASARQSTPKHASERQCTPEHINARQCTPENGRAQQRTAQHLKLLLYFFHLLKSFFNYRMCKSMSNTPFQVYLINKFIEKIMNKKVEKNAHHST